MQRKADATFAEEFLQGQFQSFYSSILRQASLPFPTNYPPPQAIEAQPSFVFLMFVVRVLGKRQYLFYG